MLRPISIALIAGAMLVAFAALPAMLPASTTLALSGSALAQKVPETNAVNLNTSRSNVNRMGGGGGKKAAKRTRSQDRMGGGGGAKGASRATNLNSSRSNTRGINLNPFMLIVPDPD